ncbi:hypothetical protein GH714_028489 [Hevea brasiliensis]|uniref:Potassium channel n=1 Tax=Hevea brasiliensis TaxID=3981 RepID=A0A6A6MLQ3_HEVBR|nr:hypothetical protein GH714_028489 [Hevea brasiliensis]
MEGIPHGSFFSSDLLPSLGARINQATILRRYIISPYSSRYRAWEMWLVVLVVYSAWISPFELAFLTYKKDDALFIIDNIVNGFFAIDIVLTFFVAYLDSQTYLLVDDPKKIAIRYISTWFLFDVCSTAPFQSLSLLFTNRSSSEIGFRLLNMLRLWRLRRVSSLFARLEKDIRFNYFWTRCTKLVSRDTVRAASEFATRNQLPPRIQDQMLSHLCLKFKTEGLKQQETLNGLPKAIRSSIARHLFYPIVEKVYLFQGVSHEFLFQLASGMEAEYFPPKEDVILQSEASTDLYILVSGTVDLISYSDGIDQVIGKATAGDIFGEIGVLYYKPQPFSARTSELSQILRLTRTSLINTIQANTEDGRIIMNNLFKKLQGSESTGFDYQKKDPGTILSEWCDGGPKEGWCFEAGYQNYSHGDPLLREVGDLSAEESEARGNGERGADHNFITHVGDVNSTIEDNQTALLAAVRKGHLEMVKILLEGGANADKPDAIGRTPKALAEQQGNKSIYDLLLSYENRRKLDEHTIDFIEPESEESQNNQGKHKGVAPFDPAGEKFGGYKFTRVINSDNAEIDDICVIRDGDHLFLFQSDTENLDCDVT